MTAWGTPELRDALTIELLERDGWRSPRDVLAECAWCGMPYWIHGVRGGRPDLQRFCSRRCREQRWYWQWIAYGRRWPKRAA